MRSWTDLGLITDIEIPSLAVSEDQEQAGMPGTLFNDV